MTSEDRDPTPDVETDEEQGSRSSRSRTKARKSLPLWQETILLLAIALVLAVAIKALFLQAFYIPSQSMEPGLVENDRILVQKPSYWAGGTPQRGDVVVFEDPGGWLNEVESAGPTNPAAKLMAAVGLYPSGGHLVKRVIGVEGDVIECCDKQGRLMINGVAIDESGFTKPGSTDECAGPMKSSCEWKAGPVPENHIFVMGDNRNHSADSSFHMCGRETEETDCVPGDEFIPEDLVVGKVFSLVWPRERWDWLDRPDAFADVPDAG
ncbi:signal peptidase I [Nocardioides pacificus]